MKAVELVRFQLSALIGVVSKLNKRPYSATEALRYYQEWAGERGWRVKALGGFQDRDAYASWIEAGDQVSCLRDETWLIVWEAEEPAGSVDLLAVDLLAEFDASSEAVAKIIDALELEGWEDDPIVDGYIAADGMKRITGAQILEAAPTVASLGLVGTVLFLVEQATPEDLDSMGTQASADLGLGRFASLARDRRR